MNGMKKALFVWINEGYLVWWCGVLRRLVVKMCLKLCLQECTGGGGETSVSQDASNGMGIVFVGSIWIFLLMLRSMSSNFDYRNLSQPWDRT